MVIKRAFKELYPKKEFNHISKLKYSGKFNSYNGNIMLKGNQLTINMSRKWKGVDDDIKIGLIQVLMNKLFKTSIKTVNIELYNLFLQKVHLSVPKTHFDSILEGSFNRVNEKYLNGVVEIPNLKWGTASKSKLGSYEYGDDKIVMSTIFKEAPEEFLDLVMYHEVLHKKHKFKSGARKSHYHTKEFKQDEKRFEDFAEMEKRLTSFLRKKRWKSFFFD